MMNMNKTIGIIGGMGPAATARLFKMIIDRTDAMTDSEHIRVVIDSNPKIPDRTKAILNHSDEPAEYIINAGKGLILQGADFMLIPCVTSHYFYEKIQKGIDVPVLNIIDITARKCKSLGLKSVGILATTGTCFARVFDEKMKENGIKVSYPEDEEQELVMDIIYNQVKAGNTIDTGILKPCLDKMSKEGVESFILGCTELPLAFSNGDYGYSYIDVLEVLAEEAITKAGRSFKK